MDDVKIDDELLIPAGRHTLPPEEVSARQRERLMRAMGQCVSERGYVETTIADVVRVARTSRTVFYRHFADKEQCFLATYQGMTRARIGASLAAAAAVESWREKLHAGIGAYFQWMAEHPEVAVTSVVEVHRAGRGALELRSRALADWARTLEGVATLAREDGHELPIEEAEFLAILLTAEAFVHDYARHGKLDRVVEREPAVQALAAVLFGISPARG
ncbi:MAG TPA: TetR/AcrR family transcriptional regulator [Solirubrobacteraceae bacterium]|jgi:AcrR family transcriptional regulator|nr:TetR/AcrR family transcriptional regulator [Solirubrobacteraceae bacterium]